MNLIIFLWLAIMGCWANEEKTGICVKARFGQGKKNIALECDDFVQLAVGSNMYADKSLLIKEVLVDPAEVLIINYPHLWGKTMNVKMLDLFLRMDSDNLGIVIPPDNETSMSFRYFSYGRVNAFQMPIEALKNPPLISAQKYVIPKHLAQNPVIYFTFGTNEECDIIYQIRTRIRNAFLEHDYLIPVYDSIVGDDGAWPTDRWILKHKIEMFQDYLECKKTMNLTQLANSLHLLSELLHRHFSKRVYIIIDDYDKPFTDLFLYPAKSFEGNESQYMKTTFLPFFAQFMKATFTKNPHLEKGFLTGLLPPLKGVLEPQAKVSECNWLNGKLSEYYGFNQWEVDSLFKYLGIPKMIQDQVRLTYGGYQPNVKNLTVYNPWSIVNAVDSLQLIPYWIKTIDIDMFLRNFLKLDPFREKLELLINGKNVTVSTAHRYFTIEEHEVLVRATFNTTDVVTHGSKFADIGLMYFYWNGYLTLSEHFDLNSKNDVFIMRLPNAEIEKHLKKKFYECVEIPR